MKLIPTALALSTAVGLSGCGESEPLPSELSAVTPEGSRTVESYRFNGKSYDIPTLQAMSVEALKALKLELFSLYTAECTSGIITSNSVNVAGSIWDEPDFQNRLQGDYEGFMNRLDWIIQSKTGYEIRTKISCPGEGKEAQKTETIGIAYAVGQTTLSYANQVLTVSGEPIPYSEKDYYFGLRRGYEEVCEQLGPEAEELDTITTTFQQVYPDIKDTLFGQGATNHDQPPEWSCQAAAAGKTTWDWSVEGNKEIPQLGEAKFSRLSDPAKIQAELRRLAGEADAACNRAVGTTWKNLEDNGKVDDKGQANKILAGQYIERTEGMRTFRGLVGQRRRIQSIIERDTGYRPSITWLCGAFSRFVSR